MSQKQLWIVGIVFFVLSIWIGLEIGVNRNWIAGIFLYVIPSVTMTSLVILTVRGKVDRKKVSSENKRIQLVDKKLETLDKDFSKIDQVIIGINVIKEKLDLLEIKISAISASTRITGSD